MQKKEKWEKKDFRFWYAYKRVSINNWNIQRNPALMKQLEFSFVATLLVLPSFFQLIISLLLLLSSAYIVRFHTPSHGTATRSKQKLIINAYAFSIAPFPSLSFLLPPFISIYFYDSYLEVLHHVVSWLSSYLFIVLRG